VNENDIDRLIADGSADDLELLTNYVAGRATAREQAVVEARLSNDETFRARLAEMRAVWQVADRGLHIDVSPADLDATWNRLVAAERSLAPTDGSIRQGVAPVASRREHLFVQRRRQPFANWGVYAAAASVLLLLGIGAWQLDLVGDRQVASVASADPVVRIATAAGFRREITLGDGSRVTLGPGSTLSVPRGYGAGIREVRLEGRAFFRVAPDPERPFLVHTRSAVTRVLGTEFDIRAYPDAMSTEIVVRSGHVGIGSSQARLPELRVLDGGDRGVVDQAGRVTLEQHADTAALLGWMAGTLTFEGVPLRDAVPELERWFGVPIRLSDPELGERRIIATFERESLDFVMTSIAEITSSQWERNTQEVVFSPR
jgi:transmembrane sensor